MPFKIYKGEDVVTEGESPLEITGIEPNTDVAAGEYQAVRVEDDRESERVDIPAFSTLPIDVTGVSVSPKTSSAEAGEAGTRKLTATMSPTDATNKTVSYEIEPSATGLSVNDSGLISWSDDTPAGEYTTTVTTEDGDYTDNHVLTLTEQEPEGFIIPRTIEVLEGDTVQLTSHETVKAWASGNELVASVNSSGEVVGVKEGVCDIKATSASDEEDAIEVVVLENEESELEAGDRVPPTSIKIIPEEHTFSEFGVARTMKIEIEPLNAITDVEWFSSNENIVRPRPDLGPNYISAWNTEGTATITVKSTVNDVEGTATIHLVNG